MDPRLQELLARNPGLILQAIQSMPASAETGEAAGAVEGYTMYDPAKTAYGQSFQRYDPRGAFVGEGQFKKPGNALKLTGEFAKDMAPLALAALGANGIGAALGQPSIFGAGGLLGNGNGLGLDWYADQPLTKLGTPLQESAAWFNPVAAPDLAASLPSAGFGAETAAAGAMTPSAALSSADKAAMFGNAGYGPGMSGLQTSAFDGVLGATGSNTLATLASDAAGSTLGSTLGNLPGKAIGGLLGAVAGAANSGDKQQTTQQRLDPRMEAMLYGADGKGGYLGAATEWFNQNKGGNPLMLQGAQMMADFYKSPQYTEGYNNLRNTGLGLLNTPMAGNPFMRG